MLESTFLIPSEVSKFNEFRNIHVMSLCERLEWPVFTVNCHCDIIDLALFCVTGLRENRRHPATYLVHGAKALNNAFRSWTRKEVGKFLFNYFIFTFFVHHLFPSYFFVSVLGLFPSITNCDLFTFWWRVR